MHRIRRYRNGLVLALALACTSAAHAQIEEDWAVFTHQGTGTICDIVNGSNAEFVVLFESGKLVTVAGVVLNDIVVNLNNTTVFPVTFQGDPAGFIAFRSDAEGLPTLFWLSLGETVIGINTLTSEPFDSDEAPVLFENTGCDACAVVDSSLCDDDGDDDDDDGFTPIFVCASGVPEGAAAAGLMLPVLGFVRRRRGPAGSK